MIKLSVLTNIPAPYKRQRLNALSNQGGIELQVIYIDKKSARHDYGDLPNAEFNSHVLEGISFNVLGNKQIWLNRNLIPKVSSFAPDAVITAGWNSSASWTILTYCKLFGIPVGVLAENTQQDSTLSKVLLKPTLPLFDMYFATSNGSKSNFQHLGIPSGDITVLPYATNVREHRGDPDEELQRQIKQELGLKDRKIVLYVGRLEETKDIDTLIEAVSSLAEVHLIIVGKGPQSRDLQSLADDRLGNRVSFPGYVPDASLASYYDLADVFVLPSQKEPWGVVINEAVTYNTPVITTQVTGAAGDLIRDGQTGVVVPPDEPDSLAQGIEMVLSDDEKRTEFITNASTALLEYTPERYAELIYITVEKNIKNNL